MSRSLALSALFFCGLLAVTAPAHAAMVPLSQPFRFENQRGELQDYDRDNKVYRDHHNKDERKIPVFSFSQDDDRRGFRDDRRDRDDSRDFRPSRSDFLPWFANLHHGNRFGHHHRFPKFLWAHWRPHHHKPPSEVPLPAALPLFGVGLAGLVLMCRRSKKSA